MEKIKLVSACIFISLSMTYNKIELPVPRLTYKFKENYFLSKDYVSNKEWSGYIYERKWSDSSIKINSMLPDTSIYYQGQSYYSNSKYSNFPVVGLSKEQIEEHIRWRTWWKNKVKSEKKLYCDNPKMREKFYTTIDPNDSLKFIFSLPSYHEISNAKSKFNDIGINIMYEDTVIKKYKSKANEFSKDPGLSFRYVIKYVSR